MKTLFCRLFVICLVAFGPFVAAKAEDMKEVRARMEKRIPQIDALKTQGALGENNRGFLEVRASAPDADSISSAENTDRRAAYAAIAAKAGTDAEAVGKKRAKQIATSSSGGVWLQRETGEWYKK